MKSCDWPQQASELLERHGHVARLLVVSARGSAPRESGAVMLLGGDETRGTIGGGRLEWQAMARARAMLADCSSREIDLQDIVLGPDLGQCCGGRVLLCTERLDRRALPALRAVSLALDNARAVQLRTRYVAGHAARSVAVCAPSQRPQPAWRDDGDCVTLTETLQRPALPLAIFGAGHVGQALVQLLRELSCFDIVWSDPRPGTLPVQASPALRLASDPLQVVADAPAGTHYLVFTHDHGLDYDICRAVLARGDAGWLGLIGSASKRARFARGLARDGFAPHVIERLTCPIGIGGIRSKLPAAIAIGVAAQLLQLAETAGLERVPREAGTFAAACNERCDECRHGTQAR